LELAHDKINPNLKKPDRSTYLVILKWLLIVMAIVLVLYFATSPVRGHLAAGFIKSGDNFLLERKYLSADLEYQMQRFLRQATRWQKREGS
jgi:uncharacterized protein involved in cysteine biosynthesis